MQVKYGKDQFNYMYRVVQFFYEQSDEYYVKEMLSNFMKNTEEYSSWMIEGGEMKIVLNMTDADLSVLLYVYENILFYTVEGQRIMNVCEDNFTKFLKKAESRETKSEKDGV